ncbi:sulfotransferase [Modicisalibacter tunisiensis]|uniref:O-linked N-acetylglucosamine transferase family protein n=1 Tax=Modicisalibacter tunisiensis TaxID=390637 RepID=UPI001CCB6439|nr:sulfotransferase [Modicisalibacter tunisiensis]MBZ9538296.1 sulfotransferase [Modicisalibacter tunisiensis]
MKHITQVPDQEQKSFLTLYANSRVTEALQCAWGLTMQYPNDTFSWKSLGNCLLLIGEFEQARSALETACDLDEQDSLTLTPLSYCNFMLGNIELAIQQQNKSLEIDPKNAQSHYNMAKIYYAKNDAKAALKHLEKAEKNNHDISDILSLRSNINYLSMNFKESEKDLLELYTKNPENPAINNNLGNYYKDLTDFDQAIHHYKKAQKISPKFKAAFSNELLAMHYSPVFSAEDIFHKAKEWSKRFDAEKKPETIRAGQEFNKKLKIGIMSSGFKIHPVGWMICDILENLPPNVDVYAYSNSEDSDFLAEKIRNSASKWTPTYHLNDDELASLINDDEIDILLDLAGHGSGSRLGTIKKKPAPLIAKWVGAQISSMAMPEFDYFISDNIETPEGSEHLYSEKIIRLPDDYICYHPPHYAPAITALPAIDNGYITLGCFNNAAKINDTVLVEWAQLLNELPESRLLLKSAAYESDAVQERVFKTLEDQGIDRNRILLEGPSRHQALLESYQRVDIALDPWPYSGGLTTCEALMMGVPVVTLPGPTFAGRHSATHLTNAGMPELVVNNWEEYRQRVIELASDLPSLAVIRASLRQVLINSPVCDAPRFARHFHKALRAIWQRHCEGKSPAALTFNKRGQAWFDGESTPVKIQLSSNTSDEFEWDFEGKIIAIDNGGQLLGNSAVREMLDDDYLELICFDPTSTAADNSLKSHTNVHYYPGVTLGNGQPSSLYRCNDSSLDGSLKPLIESQEAETEDDQHPQQFEEHAIETISLDQIEGLPSIDWLILDAVNDSATILEHGSKALQDALLVQAKVAFQATHENQLSFGSLQHWMARHGFRFYRFNDEHYRSCFPESIPEEKRQATELQSADAILIPNYTRLKKTSDDQKEKLSFLLDTIYNIQDISHSLLQEIDPEKANKYLKTKGLTPHKKAISKQLTDIRSLKNIHEIISYIENSSLNNSPEAHNLPGRLVVSLTSYKKRFSNLHLTLRSLLLQSVAPDVLVLWIAHEEEKDIPEKVWELEKHGLSIQFCEDIRSYKKIIPTLREYPDSFIVTADDDIYYDPDWLKGLIDSWGGDYKAVIAHRAHKIRLDNKGNPIPYRDWKWQVGPEEPADGLIVPTGCGGVLYPPQVFHEDVTDSNIFMELCNDADDIWLYWMASINGAKAKRSQHNFQLIEWPENDTSALWKKNILHGHNDEKIKNTIDYYGAPWGKTCSQHATPPVVTEKGGGNFLFIVGCGRSGNTLMRRLLIENYDIYIPPETYVLPSQIKWLDAHKSSPWPEKTRHLLNFLKKSEDFESFGVKNLFEFSSEAEKWPPPLQNISYFTASLYRWLGKKNGITSKWSGDKTPLNTLYLKTIQDVFPNAKFIFMERDPFDVTSSYLKSGIYGSAEQAIQRWIASYNAWHELCVKTGRHNKITISYENLVSRPEELIDFIGKVFGIPKRPQKEIIKPDMLGDVSMREHHANVTRPVFSTSIGNGKEKLTQEEIEIVDKNLTDFFKKIKNISQ